MDPSCGRLEFHRGNSWNEQSEQGQGGNAAALRNLSHAIVALRCFFMDRSARYNNILGSIGVGKCAASPHFLLANLYAFLMADFSSSSVTEPERPFLFEKDSVCQVRSRKFIAGK